MTDIENPSSYPLRQPRPLPPGHPPAPGQPPKRAPPRGAAAPPPGDVNTQLRELARLRADGVLDEQEFKHAKAKLLETSGMGY